jgi:hypothetical protein
MADLTQIAASIATPSLSSALQQTPDLPLGQAVEAKIIQIVSDGLIKLTASFGTFELKASHPALQPGMNVRLDISTNGNVTLTVLPANPGAALSSLQPPSSQSAPSGAPASRADPAVITTLSRGQQPLAPAIYSSTGQTIRQSQAGATTLPPQTGEFPTLTVPPTLVRATPTTIVAPASTPAPGIDAADIQPVSQPAPAILSAVLSEALAKQSSIAPLIANLDTLTKLSKPLPQSLQAAIEDVLQTLPLLTEDPSPQTVEQAVKRSGVFFENRLTQEFAANPSATTFMPPADFKAALLKLESVLVDLTPGELPLPKSQVAEGRLPSPHGSDAPEPQSRGEATLSIASTQQDVVSVLAKQTESAIARLRVLQFASLPATPGADPQARPAQVWHLDIPLIINGQVGIIPLQIERETSRRDAAGMSHRWRLRFALDLAELGAVHALLAFSSGMVDVTLWAEREQTCALFKTMARELHYALMDEELDVAEIEFRAGHPRQAAKRAGSTLDTRT